MSSVSNTNKIPQQPVTQQVTQPQIQPGQDLLSSPLAEISDGTTRSITSLRGLLTKFQGIPQQIKELRNKGGQQVATLQKELNDLQTKVNTDNSNYVEGLVKSINNINASLNGLNTNISGLDNEATKITTALSQANNSTAGGRNSPTSVASAPGVGQQSNIPLLSSSPSTTVPGFNQTIQQLYDKLGTMISKMKNQARPPSTYAKYTLAKGNLAKATSIQQIQQALSSVSKVSNNGQNVIFGGKRSRKIRRKYSKKHSKKLRRSSK